MDCVPSHVVLIVILLVCGSMNTLFTKLVHKFIPKKLIGLSFVLVADKFMFCT